MDHNHKETPNVSTAPSSIKGGTPVVSTESAVTDAIVEAVLRRLVSCPTLAGGSGSLVNVIRSQNAFSSLITAQEMPRSPTYPTSVEPPLWMLQWLPPVLLQGVAADSPGIGITPFEPCIQLQSQQYRGAIGKGVLRRWEAVVITPTRGENQCCGNYRSGVIEYDYNYFSLKMPNCNFNY